MIKFLFLFVGLLCQGCLLHPPYERPCMEIPDHWRITTDEASSYANYQWWEQLNDPILNCLILEALESNNDLKVAIARVDTFYGNLLVANSPLYPQISGSGTYSRQRIPSGYSGIPAALIPPITNNYITIIQASYEIDIWGKIRSGSEAAVAELLGSIEARRVVVSTIVTAVAATYLQLRQFDKQLDISKMTLKSRQESYQLAYDRFVGGLTSELEAKQSEAEMESAAAQVIDYEITVAETENLLSILVGHPPKAIERGLDLAAFVLPIDVPAGIPSQVLEQRPDILEAEQNLIAANANIGVARANFFPNFSLTGLYGNESLKLHNLFTGPNVGWQYLVNVLQPIFTGWQLTGQLDIAEAQKVEAYYAYQQTVLNAFKEVDDALIANQKLRELIVVETRRVDALVVALYLANLQYDNGQVDYLNVLDAQRNLFAAQLDQAEAQGNALISLVNLYKALGGGWVIQADELAIEEGEEEDSAN